MKEEIKKWHQESAALEPTQEERTTLSKAVLDFADDFVEKLPDTLAYHVEDRKGSGIYEHPLSEDGHSINEALKIFQEHVNEPGLNPASGGHLAYIPGGGIYASAMGDVLAAVTNKFAGVFYASPGAVRLEHMLVRWMAEIMGYPESAVGNLTSGGSIANLNAIVTAREAMNLKARDVENAVVYYSAHTHHSVQKALNIAGLAEAQVRIVPADDNFRMDTAKLEAMVVNDVAASFRPFLIIASAGTTDTGAADPLEKIAAIAQKYHSWFHVDAAFGGFFVLTEHGQKALRGIECCNSIVLDPHKGLFLPYGSGAVLVRDGKKLRDAHRFQAAYLQDTADSQDELSPAELSAELSRHFRGPRMWLPLFLHGIAPFRAALREKLLLARYFHQEIRKRKGFEAGPEPDLSIVIFRYVPESGNANDFNKRLVRGIVRDGRVFLSSTTINGIFWIRIAVLSFRTHLEHIDLTLDLLEETAGHLQKT
ncbi:MAG: aminotransferase class V-fold PLP-dependent enzyme [Bacteroidia bacterium]